MVSYASDALEMFYTQNHWKPNQPRDGRFWFNKEVIQKIQWEQLIYLKVIG